MNRTTRKAHRSSERGQVLLFVLIFIVVFGVLTAGAMTLLQVNLKSTVIVRERTERTYAADSAIEYALQRLRLDPTACASETPSSLPSQSANGTTATISCRITPGSGSPIGASGWAAIIKRDLDQQAGGSAAFNGPVYVGGDIDVSDITNTNGSVYQYSPTCPGALTAPVGLLVIPSPPHSWQCTSTLPPDPPHALPPAPSAPKAHDTYGNCRVFYPGKYTAEPDLLDNNYFVSGVYYFEGIGNWSIPVDRTIVGGTNPEDIDPLVDTNVNSCRPGADATPGGGGSGFGVTWIFGGNSKVQVNNNDVFELHTRVPGPAETGVTPRVSFVAPPDDIGGYLESTPAGGSVFTTSAGGPSVAIHGLFYAPDVDVDLDGPVGSSVFRGGAVIRDVHVKVAASVDPKPTFTIGTSKSNKYSVEITATAQTGDPVPVVARAVVEIRNTTAQPTVIVHSWRTR